MVWFWNTSKEDTEEVEEEIKKVLTQENGTWNKFTKINEKDEEHSIGRNVYPNDNSVKDYNAKYTFTHRLLKYSFLSPLVNVFQKKYRDKLLKQVPDKYEFEKLKMFDNAFEKAIHEWNNKYRRISNGKIIDAPKDDEGASDRLRFFKEVYLTIVANDTAYLEFHNIMMYELAKEFSKLEPHHLLFVDKNINDVKYFVAVDRFTPETQQLAKHLLDGYIRFAEVKENPDGTVELKVWDTAMPKFVKNTSLPVVNDNPDAKKME